MRSIGISLAVIGGFIIYLGMKGNAGEAFSTLINKPFSGNVNQ